MSYKIIGKYIKSLNFSILNAKTFFLLSKNISNYKINIDIQSNQIKEKIIEVETSLSLLPTKNESGKVDIKIIYSTIIEIENQIINKEEIEKIILIKVPTTIYPDLRRIFVFVFESSGFKEIKISEVVDFQKLYNLKKNQ